MSSRQSNVQRLPLPPESAASDVKALHDHVVQMTVILNQAVQSLQNRVNTVQQVGAKSPPNVSGFAVEGKQGLFSLVWNRIANVDGYVVVHATDTAMKQIVGRYNIPDANQPLHQISVGNVAVTGSFQVYAYQGNKYSQPSPIITKTTAVYGSAESAPVTPPKSPLPPKLAPVRNGTTI